MEQLVFAIVLAGGIPMVCIVGGWLSYQLRWRPLFKSLEKYLKEKKAAEATQR